MMGTQLRLFLTAYIVNFFLTSVQLHSLTPPKAVQSSAHEEDEVRDNLRNLFESVARDETKKGDSYRRVLRHGVAKEQQAFDSLKGDLWQARNNNVFRKKISRDTMKGGPTVMLTKRETSDEEESVTGETKRETSEEESFVTGDYPTVKTTYNPIIHDINHHEAMRKLKELWVRQLDYLKIVKQVADEVKNVTGHKIRQFMWIYNDTQERIENAIQALSDEPWKHNDDLKEALDDKVLTVHQQHTWKSFERCLDDYYEFLPKDEYEKKFRETVVAARQDLKSRQEEIKLLVEGNTTPANQCAA